MPHDLLLILAHPDDESFMAAGTVAALAESGRRVGLVCATRGQAGALGDPPLATRETIGEVREGELRDACAAIGLTLLALLEHEDRRSPRPTPRRCAPPSSGTCGASGPRVVLTFDPHGLNGHPDHVAISRFALDAVTAAADPRWAPELGAAHRVRRVVWSSPVYPWHDGVRSGSRPSGAWTTSSTRGRRRGRREAALAAHRTQWERSVRPNWYEAADRAGAGRARVRRRVLPPRWGEPPPRVPAADLFEGLEVRRTTAPADALPRVVGGRGTGARR
jgi:LmbE family N-acetylglucosaminyl deacetylase